jgi:hypothetical protein
MTKYNLSRGFKPTKDGTPLQMGIVSIMLVAPYFLYLMLP